MKTISLRYGDGAIEFELPEDKIRWIAAPGHCDAVPDETGEIRNAVRNPIGCGALRELYGKNPGRVVILIDDYTRPTPVRAILPVLLAELKEAGALDKDVTILIAAGTHRPMSEEEIRTRVGDGVFRRIRTVNHEWWDSGALADAGTTESGIPVNVNRIYLECALSIAVSNVIPHVYAGWSGGAKMVQPGVSGPGTTAMTHLAAVKRLDGIYGNSDNPIRRDMESIASLTGLKFCVNTVLDHDGRIVRVTAGDPAASHRAAVKTAKGIYGVRIPCKADAVICSSFPGYFDFWQSTKAMTAGCMSAVPGGSMILASPCPEGICPGHPDLVELGTRSFSEVGDMIARGGISDIVGATVHMTMSWCRERMKRIIVVTEPRNEELIRKLGFAFSPDIGSALKELERVLPDSASYGIITHGSEIYTII